MLQCRLNPKTVLLLTWTSEPLRVHNKILLAFDFGRLIGRSLLGDVECFVQMAGWEEET